jgi:hypothetical protein
MKINVTETVDRDPTLWCPVAKAVDDDDQAGHAWTGATLVAGTLLASSGFILWCAQSTRHPSVNCGPWPR